MDKIKPSHQILHAFCLKPDLFFEVQSKDEQAILLVRAHPITQLYWIINGFFMIALLFLLNFFLVYFFNFWQILFMNLFGLVMIFSYLWFNFLSWFFNVGLITNKKVIDIDFYSVLYKEVTTAALSHIQDMTVKSGGFFASIYNYGNLFVQTAGTEANIEFMNIPKPDEVKQIIQQLQNPNGL